MLLKTRFSALQLSVEISLLLT